MKTVGALLTPVAACLYTYLIVDTDRRPVIVLGAGTAIAFASIDFYYALNNVIADIYLADGFLELIFLTGWIYCDRVGKSPPTITDRHFLLEIFIDSLQHFPKMCEVTSR